MPNERILVDRVGKRFHRTLSGALWHGLGDAVRRLCRLKQREQLGKNEFWALRDLSFVVGRGECLGVIGPNGAGKSTLLKLIHRETSPDVGRIETLGSIKSLIHIGSGLQPLLSGRENIYIQCQQLGLDKRKTDARLKAIVAFAGLEEAIDREVKTYSDGMYARLEFSIATCVRPDILLVDEVLAVTDIAFQVRALDRLNELKGEGTTIVLVSHSEMNVRQVADRCLLLCDGRQLALGAPDALFNQYYQAVGYFNKRMQPLGMAMHAPDDSAGGLAIRSLRTIGGGEDGPVVGTGQSLDVVVEYQAEQAVGPVFLSVQFWNGGDLLTASCDSRLATPDFRLPAGNGTIRVHIPFMALTAGLYQLAAGFGKEDQWLAYRRDLQQLTVTRDELSFYQGVAVMNAGFEADWLEHG